jgi:hypothetical protein
MYGERSPLEPFDRSPWLRRSQLNPKFRDFPKTVDKSEPFLVIVKEDESFRGGVCMNPISA